MHVSVVFVAGLLAAADASVVKKPTICKEDNCLRALLNPTRPVASFCSAFLSTSTHPLPTFANPCSSSLPRISSACDCALGRKSNPQPTTSPITTLTCTAETTTVTVPGAGEITTVTVPTTVTLPGEDQVTTLTINGELTTVTIPTTVTLPGEDEITTVTIPTTITLPGEGEIITVTIPGAGEVTTVTIPTTVTLPGEAQLTTLTINGELTTVTIPTTVTLPGEDEITTVTVPTTVTLPIETETVTLPAQTVTLPGVTVTVPAQPCTTPEETGIPKSVPPYTYLQCTNNGGAQRALQGMPSTSDNQTPAACASTCTGFTYFGVTKGNECVCGNTLNPQSNNPNDSACNLPCTGNSKQFCGGECAYPAVQDVRGMG